MKGIIIQPDNGCEYYREITDEQFFSLKIDHQLYLNGNVAPIISHETAVKKFGIDVLQQLQQMSNKGLQGTRKSPRP